MDNAFFSEEKYKVDSIRAVDAKFEAQKIAFAPLTFQAVRAMLDLGLLRVVEAAGGAGVSRSELSQKSGVSEYGVSVLCEIALGMGVLKLAANSTVGAKKLDEANDATENARVAKKLDAANFTASVKKLDGANEAKDACTANSTVGAEKLDRANDATKLCVAKKLALANSTAGAKKLDDANETSEEVKNADDASSAAEKLDTTNDVTENAGAPGKLAEANFTASAEKLDEANETPEEVNFIVGAKKLDGANDATKLCAAKKLDTANATTKNAIASATAQPTEKFILGKIGWMLLNDALTKANFDFVNDICYMGAYELGASIQNGKPEGLRYFGADWTTIYEALSSLPARAQRSWFAFDHFYSDIAFPEALPIVFAEKPAHIVDIGGNTAKWAIACCKYDANVRVTIVDLPGQTAVAEQNAKAAGFSARIETCAGNVLAAETKLPVAPDAFWMSQFLDCFSLEQVTKILTKVREAATEKTNVYVLEPLWDKQKFEASAYSLQATSLYFTCMANGNSKMYRFAELRDAIERAGFSLKTAHHNLGSNSYSLLVFNKN